MKKIVSTTFIIVSLYGTAKATTITSPIYMPSQGKTTTSLNIGYTKSTFDKVEIAGIETTKEFEKSWNLNLNGNYGLNEKVSLNYGFDLDFHREMEKKEESSKLSKVYVGFTGRLINSNSNKIDILFNIGQEANKYWTDYRTDQTFANLGLRYGLDFNMYNVALTVGSQYTDRYRTDNSKIDSEFNFYTKLENEFIFTDEFTMGLDLFYTYNPKNNYFDGVDNQSFKAFSEYGFNVDFNYTINDDNYIGVYFGMLENNISQYVILTSGSRQDYRNLTEYNGGIKLTTQF